MAKKKKHEGHVNHERWMVSYADFMTLLFAVFVVLYGFAMANQNEAVALAEGLKNSFSKMGLINQPIQSQNLIEISSDSSISESASITNPNIVQPEVHGGGGMLDFGRPQTQYNTTEELRSVEAKKDQDMDSNAGSEVQDAIADLSGENQMGAPLDSIRAEISKVLEEMEGEGLISVSQDQTWLNIRISDSLVFAHGSASIINRAKPTLSKIADIIYPLNNYVRIRGYTDSTIVSDEVYKSNWELSAARSISIVNFFVEDGINPHRLAIEAFAQYSPFVSNSTEKGKGINRSVTIAISRKAYKAKELKVVPDEDEANEVKSKKNK